MYINKKIRYQHVAGNELIDCEKIPYVSDILPTIVAIHLNMLSLLNNFLVLVCQFTVYNKCSNCTPPEPVHLWTCLFMECPHFKRPLVVANILTHVNNTLVNCVLNFKWSCVHQRF
jgi:hypothetical protein